MDEQPAFTTQQSSEEVASLTSPEEIKPPVLSAPSTAVQPASASSDCLSPIVFLILLAWIILTSFVRQSINLTASIQPLPSVRWMALAGAFVQAVLLAVPLVPLAVFWRNPRYKAIFKALALVTSMLIILAPGYLPDIDAAQSQAFLHILSVSFFLLIWLLLARRGKNEKQPGQENRSSNSPVLWFTALLVAGLVSYPWLVNGALGSLLDTFLQLIFGLLLGLVAVLLTIPLVNDLRRTSPGLWQDYFLGSFSIGGILFILVSAPAFSFGALQTLLMIFVPVLGWVVMALVLHSRPTVGPLTFLIGLTTAAPMIWIDPDELALIVSSSAGEILGWAYRSAFISLALLIGSAILLMFILALRRPTPESTTSAAAPAWLTGLIAAAAAFAWAGAAFIYITSGQPGFYGERMFVILNSQADLSAAPQIADYNQRRQYVYETLVKHADDTQTDIRAMLERLGVEYTPYYLVNAIELSGNPILRIWLLTRPEVDRILDSPRMRPLPETPPIEGGYESLPTATLWNLKMIRADQVWRDFAVTGEGIVVGQSDSGVQGNHPELADSYRGKNGDNNYNWFDPWNGSTQPVDIGGHGTHTLGTIVGRNTGVAPGATWYGCVNLARNLGNPALYIDCMQFMLAPFPLGGSPLHNGDPARGAHVINNSWGCPELEGCDANTFLEAIHSLRAAGVFVVASAGNDGPDCSTLNTPPPIYAEAFAVGAIDRSASLAFFSSIGPVTVDGSNRVKPDIVAPGQDILSSLPNNTYGTNSGTSMAGPHIVGVVALMWSANPKLIGNIELTEQILRETAQPYNGRLPECPGAADHPSTASGYGIVDAYAAVQRALQVP